MKKLLTVVAIFSLILLGFGAGSSVAQPTLFSYGKSKPGLIATLINVINTDDATSLGCLAANDPVQLHYDYFYKSVDAAPVDACTHFDFYRGTTLADIVTFDISGTVGGGLALFNDLTNYDVGAGSNFDLPTVGGVANAVRGYALVTHHCAGTSNFDVPFRIGGNSGLDGEALLIDIINGAAWGYKAVIASQAAMNPYAFSPIGAGATPAIGMTTDLLPENMVPAVAPYGVLNRFAQLQEVAIYPPDEMTTRFLVTPLFMFNAVTGATAARNNMELFAPLQQKRTQITLVNRNGIDGRTDRNEQPFSGSHVIHVRCVAAVDLSAMLDGNAAWNASGGWVNVDLRDPVLIDPLAEGLVVGPGDYNAIVFKLVFGLPLFAAGDAINNADLVRDGRIW